MKKFRMSNHKGFNLVEIVIAMSIMAFALLGIFSLFTRGSSDIDYGKRQTRATSLAQDKMEELRGRAFSRNYTDPVLEAGVTHADTVELDDTQYIREWVVENQEYELTPGGTSILTKPVVKKITVQVDWKGRNSQTKTYELTSTRRRF
jgi:prepilin-type N-terminal cleavage/methylation domain-containing protein